MDHHTASLRAGKRLDEALALAGFPADQVPHFHRLSQPNSPAAPLPPRPPPTPIPPPPPRLPASAYRKGTKDQTAPPIPRPSELRLPSHNLQRKPIVSGQILRHLRNNFDILFLQEINHTPILPHVYAYGSGTKATIVSNICQDKNTRGEHGSIIVCSPRLSRFVTPVPRLDTEGLLAAAILTLPPPSPPTLLVSMYAPGTDTHR